MGGLYPLAVAVLQSTTRVVVVAGSAAGGLVVALLGARPALGADAATFIASALLIQAGVRSRQAAAGAHTANPLSLLLAAPAWSSATLRSAPSCAWAGWLPSTRSPRASPSRTRAGSGEAQWRPAC